MRSWREDFGWFSTNARDWQSRKEITMGYSDYMTGEQMVITAIRLAKKYNCRIVDNVKFMPGLVGGTVSFTVECHSQTYRYFYDGGRAYKLHSSEVKQNDLERYREQFGTTECVHVGFKKQYWFTDNWDGHVHYYPSLRKAKEEARKQTGVSCCIYETSPYGRMSRIVCFAPASGSTPP